MLLVTKEKPGGWFYMRSHLAFIPSSMVGALWLVTWAPADQSQRTFQKEAYRTREKKICSGNTNF